MLQILSSRLQTAHRLSEKHMDNETNHTYSYFNQCVCVCVCVCDMSTDMSGSVPDSRVDFISLQLISQHVVQNLGSHT